MADEVKSQRASIGEAEELDSSQRIIRAIIGGVVVILGILLVLGAVNFLRSRFQSPPVEPTVSAPPALPSSAKTPAGAASPAPNADYQAMPETGPEHLGLVLLVLSLAAGRAAVAISRKFA